MNESLIELITNAVIDELGKNTKKEKQAGITVGVSGRHVHLTKEHLDFLFGTGYELTRIKRLMGGQYACEEYVTIVGANLRAIEKVRVLGPLRSQTQVEISKTDSIKLGINAPVRDSGDLKDSAPIVIVGPRGALTLKEGCIIARRHIHMTPKEAEMYKVKDNELVSVKFLNPRGGILDNVLIRVKDTNDLEMHIDTDEANALGIRTGCLAKIIR